MTSQPPPYYGTPGTPHTGEPLTWQPYYGASFSVAVKRFFTKYATFHGRASRAEFWWVYLFQGIVWFALVILGGVAGIPGSSTDAFGNSEPGPGFIPFGILIAIWMFGTIVPNIAVSVRRLHDTDRSGWFFLLTCIPYIGWIFTLVFMIPGPTPGGQRYDRPQ